MKRARTLWPSLLTTQISDFTIPNSPPLLTRNQFDHSSGRGVVTARRGTERDISHVFGHTLSGEDIFTNNGQSLGGPIARGSIISESFSKTFFDSPSQS